MSGILSIAAIFFLSAGFLLLWLDQVWLTFDLNQQHLTEPWSSLSHGVELHWDGERPLKFLFLGWGSRGDHQPNIALGLELARRGHNVTIMGLTKYKSLIQEHPSLNYSPLEDSHLWSFADAMRQSDGSEFLPRVAEYVDHTAHELFPQYLKAGQEADVLIGQHGCTTILPHMLVAEVLKKPIFLLTHDVTLPTADYSFNPAENRVQDYGYKTNVFNHRIFGIIFGAMTTKPNSVWRKLRKEHGVQTSFPFMDPLQPEAMASIPVFHTYDPILWPPPSDHSKHWHSTGYLVTADGKEGTKQEDLELQDWIDARPKGTAENPRRLVYFGQGSYSMHNRQFFTKALLDVLTELDIDAIALASTVEEGIESLPNLKIVNQLDQTRIFPQCDLLVHHGGAGTASQCIRSGKPGICIPAMPFQEAWGGQIADHGAGVLLRPHELVGAWEGSNRTNLLLQAIQEALSPMVQGKAAELAKQSDRVSGRVQLAADRMLRYLEDLQLPKERVNDNKSNEL